MVHPVRITSSHLASLVAMDNRELAEKRVLDDFNARWYGVLDGCGFNCPGCGIREAKKSPFGCEVTILYRCGMKERETIPCWENKVFVSPLGTVHTMTHTSVGIVEHATGHESDVECAEDADCAPAQCCHPTSCVSKESAPDCRGIACSLECRSGTMDCGAGYCSCIDGKCQVVWGRG